MTKLDIILAFILLFFTPSLVFSQNSKLTVNVKNTTIRETVKLIEAQSSYRFFYNDQLSGLNSLVTIEIEDTSIQNVLGQIFSDQKLTFTMLENNMVVISPVEIALIRSIIGEIIDGLGRPLQGVNVICLGTSRGTITDADGRFAIDVIGKGYEKTQENGLKYEAEQFGLICESEDKNEGITAFIEKRQPNFKDK